MPTADDRRAEAAALRLENTIRKVVDASPPLTLAQLDRLAALFAPGTTPAADRADTAAVAS